jgi:hypothetical protein
MPVYRWGMRGVELRRIALMLGVIVVGFLVSGVALHKLATRGPDPTAD